MKTKLAISLFIANVIAVGTISYFLFTPAGYYIEPQLVFLSLILWLIGISYLCVSVAFAIIRNYHFFKREIYQKPLDGFKKTIERESKWTSDLFSFVSVSTMFNFFILGLLILSPLVPILEEVPYVHLINLPIKVDEKLFNGSLTNTDGAILLIIIFTGPTFLFVLRQLHYKLTRCDNMKRYPGSRILLTFFCYGMPAVIVGNMISQYIKTGIWGISSESLISLYQIAVNFVVVAGLIVIITIWIIDRKLFAK